ncbi:MAG: hypothetical protein IIB12_03400 [Chloroflexi bacterium]|nr:hypothetical protein [Chloroflexota bacterium]
MPLASVIHTPVFIEPFFFAAVLATFVYAVCLTYHNVDVAHQPTTTHLALRAIAVVP